ncbi:hypothetical protein ACG02S_21860 [Roseateles sp. DC23W]|uniref:Uncharacterized protein n=1 Tax=Pelomonas dachongensis TaxID=3299029 RepID=A0ABW7ESR0_9BURK
MRLRRSRAAGMALVLAVHGLAIWLVWRALADREPAAPSWRTVVRLLPLPVPLQPAAEKPAPPAARRVDARPAAAAPAPVPVSSGELTAGAGDAPAAPGVGAAPAGPPAVAPLVLVPSREVLRGALANPATQDPRSNSPRPTAQERMAMAIDNQLCVREERLPDGSVRRWMGRLQRAVSNIEARTGHRGIDVSVCE